VRGEFIRISTVKSNKQINLTLSNEHFSVEKPNRIFTPLVRFEEKQPLLYDKKTFEVFDGQTKWTITKQERNKLLYDFSGKYILIDRLGFDRDELDNKRVMTIEEEYKEFIEIADTLKHESKGMINLYNSGNYHDTALSLFDRVSKYINPEPILQDEAEFLRKSLITIKEIKS
jgi:hypothetical protein